MRPNRANIGQQQQQKKTTTTTTTTITTRPNLANIGQQQQQQQRRRRRRGRRRRRRGRRRRRPRRRRRRRRQRCQQPPLLWSRALWLRLSVRRLTRLWLRCASQGSQPPPLGRMLPGCPKSRSPSCTGRGCSGPHRLS